jgi:hypothetical protein
VWEDQDIAELTINAKALGAARNILFASIKDPNQRPFKDVPDVKGFIDMTFAKKALEALEAEKKAEGEKPKGDAPAKKEETPAAPPPAAPKQN